MLSRTLLKEQNFQNILSALSTKYLMRTVRTHSIIQKAALRGSKTESTSSKLYSATKTLRRLPRRRHSHNWQV